MFLGLSRLVSEVDGVCIGYCTINVSWVKCLVSEVDGVCIGYCTINVSWVKSLGFRG